MKKFLLALTLALSACVDVGGSVPPVVPVVNEVVLKGEDALSKAADAYAGVTLIAAEVVKHGGLTNGQLVMLAMLNDRALVLLEGADGTLTAAERASSVFLIITQMHSIIGQ